MAGAPSLSYTHACACVMMGLAERNETKALAALPASGG